jgi:O-antigen ligase
MAWKAGVELFKSYPLGIGPGQFEDYSIDYQKSMGGAILILTPSSHNLYLRVLAENGFIGLILIIAALAFMLFALVKSRKIIYSSDISWIFSCLIGIIVQSFVIDTLHWRHFWILLGFLIALVNLYEEKGEKLKI